MKDFAIIPLTQKKVAVVDIELAPFLSRFRWHAAKHGHSFSARRGVNVKRDVTLILMHRYIMGVVEGQVVDHINGDALDNRLINLRICTAKENSWNSNKTKSPTSSPYKGVHFAKGCVTRPWRAIIQSRGFGGLKNLGYYATPEEAAMAYDRAALKIFGKFAKPNFPKGE